MLRRLFRWVGAGLFLAAIAGYTVVNLAADDPAEWHLDPATVALRGTPNEYLAAVPGATSAVPDRPVTIIAKPPAEVLACFDRIARGKPRVTVLAGDLDSGMITYVQRSRLVGYPDYITVKAVPEETGMPEKGTGLIVYSRSRYGHSDLGVNEARVADWMADVEKLC